ncbi:patatin-like phospholipase family protein [Colwellia sp. RSH04]|uniref:patatin-like phospholipase family protein n=1 Tax=Colwellia sp. RSH04 TaxID=2305464 RepID=UPI000E58F83D|nr:patatin-like phospholipase family protein [Colwellia sp. RSH04]RHW75511.1 serine protease [Colwellia sp. RSH04]
MNTKSKKSVSLVLGSGGARGLAHIGVIRWLNEHHFNIQSISGCSIGALVGGIYAANKLDEFEQWVKAIDKVDIVTLLDISWRSSGLVKGERIIKSLTKLVGDVMIEELPIKYTAVAADIANEKEVWMNSGKLFDAIRASISLPLLFTPVEYKGVHLIDGGVLNPVPIAPTFSDPTEFKIAVNLGADVENTKSFINQAKVSKPKGFELEDKTSFTSKIQQFIADLTNKVDDEDELSRVGAYDIANQAFDAMQNTISRQKLAAYPPDFTIDIARNACGILEFDKAEEMIELGYVKAEQTLKAFL